ncbi:hypothetical protein AMECASPLE_031803 [Ameca splendens]|uniref:Ig-like domain-containing protein n=1 Tax=Ameca splendens TaxID=208324 RepID=A0ABV0XVW6_9TELE
MPGWSVDSWAWYSTERPSLWRGRRRNLSGLIKPIISGYPQGNITFGQNVTITCSVPDGQAGGTFVFKNTPGTLNLTVNSISSSATFHIPQVRFEDEGSYQCQFKIKVYDEEFSPQFGNPVQLNLTGILILK